MNKIIVIHHSADFDGLFSREIARKFFGPSADYIGWDYGDPIPLVPDDADLYMLDISIAELMAHPRLTWIDHHKTAIEQYAAGIRGYRIDGVAACRLAWQWFFRDTPGNIAGGNMPAKEDYVERRVKEPLAVRLAGEYDIWDKRDPDAELFQHGLRSQELSDNMWMCLLVPQEPEVAGQRDCGTVAVECLLEAGKAIQFVREKEYAQVVGEQGFTVEWEGLKFLACCSHECDIRSHLFAAGIKPEHDALIGFTYTGTDWRFSLYGVPGKPDIDLSAIAKKYGGGGHKQACGFRAEKIPFFPWSFDSTSDTLAHIRRVNWLVLDCARELMARAQRHDESKLKEPEKSGFDRLQALQLSKLVYGSDEYRACLRKEKPAISLHYSLNSHHPEFYPYGVDDMSLLDVLEMLCDWKAASERMKDGGSILRSIEVNISRFGLSTQIAHVLVNTAEKLGWIERIDARALWEKIGGVPPKA